MASMMSVHILHEIFRQTPIQHQTMENIHWLFQLSPSVRNHRWENYLHAWWLVPRAIQSRINSPYHETNRGSRYRYIVKFKFSKDCFAIYCGQTLKKIFLVGLITSEVYLTYLART
jgi:hypothetical protein